MHLSLTDFIDNKCNIAFIEDSQKKKKNAFTERSFFKIFKFIEFYLRSTVTQKN